MKAWLKGGLVGVGLLILFLIISNLSVVVQRWVFGIAMSPFSILIFGLPIWGSLIGWVIGKVKKKG